MKNLPATCLAFFVLTCAMARGQTDVLRPDEISSALSAGFKAEDSGPLQKFLRDWDSQSNAVTAEMLAKKPAFEQAVYGLYPVFFAPVAARLDAKYLIVQSSIDVHVVEGNVAEAYRAEMETFDDQARRMPSISHVTIRDFRPAVKVDRKNILYLNDQCAYAMLQFLTGKELALERYWDEPNGDSLFGEHAERKRRLQYLNSLLCIVPGHWETGWHLPTHPKINCLVISSDLKAAVVYFRRGYGGGAALLQSRANKWVVVDRQEFWVE
jgi:hypothetical protein